VQKLCIYGDSIIENSSYVADAEPDVTAQIKELLPDLEVKSYAVDGARCDDIINQIRNFPPHADDLILLTGGGNDAMDTAWILEDDTERTFPEVLKLLVNIKELFRKKYQPIANALQGRRVLAATIYDPNLDDPINEGLLKPAIGLLTAYNDVIQQEANSRGFSVLELRNLFTDATDFANPIEPSMKGGAKIAQAVRDWIC